MRILSITENQLDKALDYASRFVHIDHNTREIIKQSRKSFLFSRPTNKSTPAEGERSKSYDIWAKKDGLFDVIFGLMHDLQHKGMISPMGTRIQQLPAYDSHSKSIQTFSF